MSRKYDSKEIDLKIVDVTTGKNRLGTQFLNISWMATIGFGEYIFYKERNSNWRISSETMDSNDDKEFGKELLSLWLNECEVN